MFPNLIRPAGFASSAGVGGTYSTAIATLQDSTGMAQIVSAFADDASQYLPDPGIDFPIYGATYRSNISIGSNWYLLFGLTSTAYSGLSRTSPGRGLLFGAADRSWQNVYFKAESGFCRIRFEGHVGSGGSSSTAIFQIKLFADGTIELTIGIGAFYSSPAAITSLTKGDNITYTDFTAPAGSTAQSDFTSTAVLTSIVFRPVDVAGNSHTVQVGSYSCIAPAVAGVTRNTTLLNALSYAALNNSSYGYYASTYEMPALYDGNTSAGMMAVASVTTEAVYIQVQLSASSYLNRLVFYGGQFNGSFNVPDSIKIYAGLVSTGTTATPLYSNSALTYSATGQILSLIALTAFDTPLTQLTIAFALGGSFSSSISVNEFQIQGYSA